MTHHGDLDLSTLSRRGRRLVEHPPESEYLRERFARAADAPDRYVPLCIAENALVADVLLAKMGACRDVPARALAYDTMSGSLAFRRTLARFVGRAFLGREPRPEQVACFAGGCLRQFVRLGGAAFLLAAAAVNLNSSKSNVYRLAYRAALLSGPQAKALPAGLDRLGPMSEARMKQWLAANFRRCGVDPAAVRKTVLLPVGEAAPESVLLLLADPADAAALATTVKSSKSNSSE